jgi:cytolysin-activating lysine-acyltransferase
MKDLHLQDMLKHRAKTGGMLQKMSIDNRHRLIGEVVSLLVGSNFHRRYFIDDIGAVILPALDCNQFRIYKEKGRVVGFISWAYLTSEVDKKYSLGKYNLKLDDWYKGDILWTIDFAAPFGHAKEIIADLRNNLFPNSKGKAVRVNNKGEITTKLSLLGKNVVSNK